MKAKTFENLIRKVVREEIDYALRREIKTLKEDLRDELKPTITEHTERLVEVPETTKNSLRDKIMGTKPIKKVKKQNFTTNNTLNDLLNETAAGDTNLETGNAPVSLAEPFASGAPMSANTADMPKEVAKAVTRDYSELMKAINKKKGK
jgi:DNA-binding ferritin-like protein